MIQTLFHIIHLLLAKILELEFALRLNAEIIASNKVTIDDYKEMSSEFLDKLNLLQEESITLKKLLFKAQKPKVVKTSRNSDLPPSKDTKKAIRNRRNNRIVSGKKPGGQPGHKGHTLEMSEKPTETIDLVPLFCSSCGKPLDQSKKKLVDSKQEIDIPPAAPIIRQFNRFEIVCSCGQVSKADFPERINAKVQYGPQLRATINYMNTFQLIPFFRLKQLIHTFFGIHISTGTLCHSVQRSAKLAQSTYINIKNFLANSPILGSDETFITVNGKRYYLWAWQNKYATFITAENSRKKEVIYKHFPKGFPNSLYISDRLPAHLSVPALDHQVCWVHLLRKLKYLEDAEDNPWIHQLEKLFRIAEALDKEKNIWSKHDKEILDLDKDLNALLVQKIDQSQFPKSKSLQKKLLDIKHMLFTFLFYKDAPFHNNGTERTFRISKVKMKVSGQFKANAQPFAVNRSIIDTIIKNDMPIFQSLYQIELGQQLVFPFA